MRGTVAKRLRKEARKIAKPTEYNVTWFKRLTGKTDDKGKPVTDVRGTVTCTGYRRIYQDMKRHRRAA